MIHRLSTLALGALFAVGASLAAAPMAQASGPDKLVERLQKLRADYTTTMGMYDHLRADAEALSVLPDAAKVSGISSDQFRSALTSCWDAPVEAIKGAERNAIDVKRAAERFQDRTAMRELKDTQTEVQNARRSVKSCKPAAMDSAKPDTDKMSAEATKALDEKVELVDEMRVLSKHELPSRSKRLSTDAAKLQGDVLAAIKSTEAKAQAAAKSPFGDKGKKERKQLSRLQEVEKEANELQALITRDMGQMPSGLAETAKTIGKNIVDVSALIGK